MTKTSKNHVRKKVSKVVVVVERALSNLRQRCRYGDSPLEYEKFQDLIKSSTSAAFLGRLH